MLGGTIWAFLANQRPTPEPTTSSSTPSQTPTPTPTPSATTIAVDALGLEGMDCTEASADGPRGRRRGRGLRRRRRRSDGRTTSTRSTGVSPTGNIPPSQLLTLTFYVDQVAMPAPAAPTMAGTVVAGEQTQVSWGGYTCPSARAR